MNIQPLLTTYITQALTHSKQEVIKMNREGGPGQLTGTSYVGHCNSEITGSNAATCRSALNTVINACPVNEPMGDQRREEEG
jgi:hypothetical protein